MASAVICRDRPSARRLAGYFSFALALIAGSAISVAADDDAPVKHRIMVCEYSGAAHRLAEIDAAGKLTWEYTVPSIAVCFRTAGDGKVLFADGGHPTGALIVDRDRRIVVEYRSKCEQILGCDLLPGGNILLGEQGPCRAVEVNPQHEVVSTVNLTTREQTAHNQLRCLHKLENGHILACHEVEGVVREYDPAGAVVWEYPGLENVFEALRLPSGNTLISGGTQRRVLEVTPDKQLAWELTAADAPDLNLTWVTSLQVLASGNLVIGNFLRGQEGRGAHAFEVTHDAAKRIVWRYADHDLVKSITMVKVLDDDAPQAPGRQ